jgi:hypothetical protein
MKYTLHLSYPARRVLGFSAHRACGGAFRVASAA